MWLFYRRLCLQNAEKLTTVELQIRPSLQWYKAGTSYKEFPLKAEPWTWSINELYMTEGDWLCGCSLWTWTHACMYHHACLVWPSMSNILELQLTEASLAVWQQGFFFFFPLPGLQSSVQWYCAGLSGPESNHSNVCCSPKSHSLAGAQGLGLSFKKGRLFTTPSIF